MKFLKKFGNVLLVVLILSSTSCNNSEISEKGNDEFYFDLELFVDEYMEKGNVNFDVMKKVVLNGKEEIKNINAYDVSPELEVIKKFNINKPALQGKYSISESKEGEEDVVTYTALEDDLNTKYLEIRRSGGDVISLKIEAEQKSILSDNKQSVIFAPEKSYHLIAEDNNRFGKVLKKEILITF